MDNTEIVGESIFGEIWKHKWGYFSLIVLYFFHKEMMSIEKMEMQYVMFSFFYLLFFGPVVSIHIRLKDTASYFYVGGHHSKFISRKRNKNVWIGIFFVLSSYLLFFKFIGMVAKIKVGC